MLPTRCCQPHVFSTCYHLWHSDNVSGDIDRVLGVVDNNYDANDYDKGEYVMPYDKDEYVTPYDKDEKEMPHDSDNENIVDDNDNNQMPTKICQ